MRKALIIVVLSLLSVQAACSRKNSSSGTNSTGSTQTTAAEAGVQARGHLESGKELYLDDQDDKAVEAFQRAINSDPDLAEAHFRLGLAFAALGKEAQAEQSYKKAVESYKKYFSVDEHTKDVEAHYNLAQTYAGLHQYSEAVREYRQAIRSKADDADIYYDLGLALTRLAQYDEAAAAFSKSLEIDPENFRAEDGLEEAREGVKRIRAGKRHQEELLKKEKEEELKKQQDGSTPNTGSKPDKAKKPQI